MKLKCCNCGMILLPTNFDSVLTQRYVLWCGLCHTTYLFTEQEMKDLTGGDLEWKKRLELVRNAGKHSS